jgi:hypothetical protein
MHVCVKYVCADLGCLGHGDGLVGLGLAIGCGHLHLGLLNRRLDRGRVLGLSLGHHALLGRHRVGLLHGRVVALGRRRVRFRHGSVRLLHGRRLLHSRVGSRSSGGDLAQHRGTLIVAMLVRRKV